MKFISGSQDTEKALAHWAGHRKLVIASHFFWNSGTDMQKSQLGLFRTLLFQILRACPDVLDRLFPEGRIQTPWDVGELVSTFARIESIASQDTCFCFFIDGLDEYDGAEEHIIDVIRNLTSSPNVKICTSSRPWPAFYGEWNRSVYSFPVQDFTLRDMTAYIQASFAANTKFRQLAARDKRYKHLVETIAKRAQGVWLWVYLVVRALLRDMRDNEPYERLEIRLDSYPPELDKFFEKIILRIDPIYRTETAQLFLLAIEAQHPMSILALPLLEKVNHYETTSEIRVEKLNEKRLTEMYERWHPRLQNRCRDLMRLSQNKNVELWRRYQVEFLHRTVRDYLQEQYMSSLRTRIPDDFDERIFLSELMMIGVSPRQHSFEMAKPDPMHSRLREMISELLYYLRQIQDEPRSSDSVAVVTRFMEALEASRGPSGLTHWVQRVYDLKDPASYLSLAVSAGLHEFVLRSVLENPGLIDPGDGDSALDHYMLFPQLISIGPPCISKPAPMTLDLIENIASHGLNPNKIDMHHEDRHSFWEIFVSESICYWGTWDRDSHRTIIHAMEIMLQNGAPTRLKMPNHPKGVNLFDAISDILEPAEVRDLELAVANQGRGRTSILRSLRPQWLTWRS